MYVPIEGNSVANYILRSGCRGVGEHVVDDDLRHARNLLEIPYGSQTSGCEGV